MSRSDWLDAGVLRVVIDEQLMEHGGASGIRAEGLFLSVSVRPQQLANHRESARSRYGRQRAEACSVI